jgi:hypothetical protein
MKKLILIITIYSLANSFSFAQEMRPDTVINTPNLPSIPLTTDPFENNLKLDVPVLGYPLNGFEFDSLAYDFNLQPDFNWDNFQNIAPPKFRPGFDFGMGTTRWEAPVLGAITIFSPILNYHFNENFSVYGGVSFAQYHNLSYIQNIVAPGFPAKSNITADMFVGGTYRLWDRIILQANYQRSLYNQLPANMMMFAPGQNVLSTGVAVDIWNGLGVMIDHVWEFDDHGKMRRGFRYSPYIDARKLMKFFGAE